MWIRRWNVFITVQSNLGKYVCLNCVLKSERNTFLFLSIVKYCTWTKITWWLLYLKIQFLEFLGLLWITVYIVQINSEAEFSDKIQTKVFKVFLLAIDSHLYSFAFEIENSISWVFGTFVNYRIYRTNEFRGRILGQNPDKSLKSFPPCYWQSPLLYSFAFEISFSSNSRNLLRFLEFSYWYCTL